MPIFPAASRRTPTPMRITRFRGLNVSEDPTQLADNESPDMLNMLLDNEGAPQKRTGFKEVLASLGAGPILGIFQFGTAILVAHGTTLRKYADDFTDGTVLSSSMSGNRVKFFVMNEFCYIMDGVHYLQFDGTTLQDVVPYIPTLTISASPAGGGQVFEQRNLLGAGFEQSFSGDGTATEYHLILTGLDATAIVASTDGGLTYNKVETTDFTVNRTTGVVTWISAPALGVNNVKIRAFRTYNDGDKIRKCTGFKIFGGTNDTRVFFWGSDANTLYRSDIYRPNYVPENYFQRVGSNAEKIMAVSVQYDTAVIDKERSKWGMTYNDTGTDITFPVRPINDTIGCLAPESVQIIENNPVSLTRQGLHMLAGGTVRDERNVSHQSRRVDRMLLRETGLAGALGFDFDKKYYLALNGRIYVWDYLQPTSEDQIGEWYLYDNMPVSTFFDLDGKLYFGTTNGEIMRVADPDELDAYSDNGDAIQAHYMTKQFDMGAFDIRKNVPRIYTTIKADIQTTVEIYTLDGRGTNTLQGTASASLISYAEFDYGYFTYLVTAFPTVLRSKIKLKKITHMQLKYVNNKPHQSLKILGISFEPIYGSPVK
ncbi:hypothetical protein [Cohnella sp. GCM10012308]|uniref:hypothetical protein n=1 Tax=Cohnella sp. GCM10012308 TaxID=3317329 RepID=UPI00360CF106